MKESTKKKGKKSHDAQIIEHLQLKEQMDFQNLLKISLSPIKKKKVHPSKES